MPAIGQSGSEGGAKSAFVPTPINSPGLQAWGSQPPRKCDLKGRHTYVGPNRIISGGGARNRFGCPYRAIFISFLTQA